MKAKNLRTKMLLVAISIGLVCIVSFGWITVARAGFEEDFIRILDRELYWGAQDTETLDFIENTCRVLHNENLEILRQIEELKAEVSELRQLIEKIE